jgi:hypothetical protein
MRRLRPMAWDDPGGSGQARSRRGTLADPAGANPLKSIDCALMDGYRRLRTIRLSLAAIIRRTADCRRRSS